MASKNELNEIITIYNDPLLKMAPNNNYIENNYIKNIVYINNSILKDDYHRDFDGCRSYYPVKNKPPIDDKPSTKKTNDEPEKIPVQPIIPQADTSAINPPVKKKIPTEPEKSPLPPFVDKPQINDKPKKTIDDEPEKIPVQPIIPQADTSAINPQSIKDKVAQLLKQKKETPPNSEQKTEIEFYDPQKIVSYLDRFVTGQESAKKTIALAFSDYLNTGIVTPSLFVGPSGSGKTYMTDLLCRAAKIPYVKISMANVTSEGYKGRNLTEGLEGLLGKDKGIIFLDEFDKLASNDDPNNPGFGPKLQKELLALMTGERIKISNMNGQTNKDQMENEEDEKEEPTYNASLVVVLYHLPRNKDVEQIRQALDSRSVLYDEVSLSSLSSQNTSDTEVLRVSNQKTKPVVRIQDKILPADNLDEILIALGFRTEKGKSKKKIIQSTNVIDTSKYLILCAGAFAGSSRAPSLQQIIQGRLGGSVCRLNDQEILEQMSDKDIIEYGLIPEIVGRLQRKCILYPQDADGLLRVLKSPEGSPYQRWVKRFKDLGINLEITEEGLQKIAELAMQGVGVRALETIIGKTVEPYSFDRTKYHGQTIVISETDIAKIFGQEPKFIEADNYFIDWNNPRSIVEYLTNYVPGQEDAKFALAKAFHLYQLKLKNKNSLELPQSNVLIIGPTGCGKTFSVELLAKKAKMPIVKANLATPSESIEKALDSFPSTQKEGIVYVDEADKVLMNLQDPRINTLIGYLENGSYRGLDLSRMLFILSGAFQKLYDRKRQETSGQETGLRITRSELEAFGCSKEVLGRLPIIANIMPMSLEQLVGILRSPKSILNDYKNYFSLRGINLNIDDEVYTALAESALKTQQGARALKSVCDKLFTEYMFNPCEGNKLQIDGETARKYLGVN